jgi:lipopolysaccharide assembly protein A
MLKVLVTALAVLAAVFALQNTDPVALKFIVWRFESPLVLILLTSVILGIAIGMLALFPSQMKKRRQIAADKKHIAALEQKQV